MAPDRREPAPALVWFRDDLRVADNPALSAAAATGRPVVCLFVLEEDAGLRSPGGAARWWLHHSLAALDGELRRRGGRLVLRRGPAPRVLDAVLRESGAAALFWNRRAGAAENAIDDAVAEAAGARGIEVTTSAASLLFEPEHIRTGAGTAFSVFTPFWRACLSAPEPRPPLPAPASLRPGPEVEGLPLSSLGLLPEHPDWAEGLRETWRPGERDAHEALDGFLGRLDRYEEERDLPGAEATSGLSPRLRWGELSPQQVWHAVAGAPGSAAFLRELGWREFAYHTLAAHPRLATENLRTEFDAFPWPPLDREALRAWQRGRTGIPLVDAGMRELWRTGTMAGRVRMVAASFLTKNLLIDWRHGERWFWDTLVDADPASNPFNWQWVAGSGADAAPYFRVFNPELQRERFDPHGDYVRRWVPEWRTAAYPEPMADLAASRREALAAYEAVKRVRG